MLLNGYDVAELVSKPRGLSKQVLIEELGKNPIFFRTGSKNRRTVGPRWNFHPIHLIPKAVDRLTLFRTLPEFVESGSSGDPVRIGPPEEGAVYQ